MKNTFTINANGKFEVECVDMVDSGSNSILLNVITGENPESLHIYMNDSLITTFSGLISASENLLLLPDDCYVADSLLKIQYGSDSFLLFSFPSSNIGNMTVERVSDFSYSVKYTAEPNSNKLLWSGAEQMGENTVITLAEPISKQKNGIVLVFSYCSDNNAVKDYQFQTFFKSKLEIELLPDKGHQFILLSNNFAYIAAKYLYINDSKITGNIDNTASGTASTGITYSNNRYVLRYVIGV